MDTTLPFSNVLYKFFHHQEHINFKFLILMTLNINFDLLFAWWIKIHRHYKLCRARKFITQLTIPIGWWWLCYSTNQPGIQKKTTLAVRFFFKSNLVPQQSQHLVLIILHGIITWGDWWFLLVNDADILYTFKSIKKWYAYV